MRLLILCCCMTIFKLNAQTPDQVVQQQLEAYNARNIDSFMACFHSEITIWTLGEEKPSVQGFDAVKALYAELFKISPDLHSTVINRSVIGAKVIDYERISGRKGSKTDIFLVMIYEVKDGKIWRAWAVREN
jgi:hypothetical protein